MSSKIKRENEMPDENQSPTKKKKIEKQNWVFLKIGEEYKCIKINGKGIYTQVKEKYKNENIRFCDISNKEIFFSFENIAIDDDDYFQFYEENKETINDNIYLAEIRKNN